MRIGLTYDLRDDYLAAGYSEEETAEFDRPDTIDSLEGALRALGYETDRIGHARELVSRLAKGDRWDLVFNIAEGLRGVAREAQVPAILDVFAIPYVFSDPLTLSLTLHKGLTKRVVRDLGLATPAFVVVEREEDIAELDLSYPLFAKPIAEGTGKGITAASKIANAEQLRSVCMELLEHHRQPVLVEEFLPGREFTVGIVGTGGEARSLGVLEVILRPAAEADVYSYVNKERCEDLVTYELCEDATARYAEEIALAAWRGLGCRDGGRVDLRCDLKGYPQFMEINPLAGLHPEHSDLPILCAKIGVPYVRLIEEIINSALARLPVVPDSPRASS